MATRESVKTIAKKLRGSLGMASGPVDVELAAKAVGAIVTFEPFKEDLSGVLVKDTNPWLSALIPHILILGRDLQSPMKLDI